MARPHVYVGIDLSDRYAKNLRPNHVCLLTGAAGRLVARFEEFTWSAANLNAAAVARYVETARAVYVDGPQGRALSGRTRRDCERVVNAPGRVPEKLPPLGQPFAGSIRSSVELFQALRETGYEVDNDSLLGLQEVFPSAIWPRSRNKLAGKGTAVGRRQRDQLLATLGVILPVKPLNDDQRDAAIAALLAAAADDLVAGVTVKAVGEVATWDEEAGFIREGRILVPEVEHELSSRLGKLTGEETRERRPTTSPLLHALISRVARIAVGPSVARMSPKGTVTAAREVLRSLPLEDFGTAREDDFNSELNRWTTIVRNALPEGARSWGLARKLLNIYLRDAVYNVHLREHYRLDRCAPFCELPMDSIVSTELRAAVWIPLPAWEGVSGLTPKANERYQAAASAVAAALGFERLHLDSFWWSQSRDEE